MTEPINPEILATKLARLPQAPISTEVLWFIQARPRMPGGLKKLSEEIIAILPSRIGTATMRKLASKASFSAKECYTIWREMPEHVRSKWIDNWRVELEVSNPEDGEWFDPDSGRNIRILWDEVTKQNKSELHKICKLIAADELPDALTAMCVRDSDRHDERWYMDDLVAALSELMETYARSQQRLAMTKVAIEVFDALNYGWSERVVVQIEGDSRFGKTEAIQSWCAMYPGRARLVSVPCSNLDGDLYKAVADAIGLDYTLATKGAQLKAKVEYVLRHSGLFLIFDEAHFLIPARYSVSTPPMRLNWIRTEIMDRGVPVALVTTPQSFQRPLQQFVKKTGHTIEQFLGRTMLKKTLPHELDSADLVAVAKVHFPEVGDDYLELIAAKAMQSELYLKAVEAIAKRARYLARQDKAGSVGITHIDRAAEDVIGTPAPTTQPSCRPNAPTLKRRFKTSAAPVFASPEKRGAQPISHAEDPEQRQLNRIDLAVPAEV